MVVLVLPEEQALLPHLVMTRSVAVVSWYEITGRPSLPMVIEDSRPWLLAEVMVVEVLPAVQAVLPHLVMTRSKVVASWCEITGRPSVPMVIEENSPWLLAEVMVVEVWLVAWLVAMVEGARLLPMVITGLAVLRLKRLAPAVFCIWKAVAELVEFWNRACPEAPILP